MVSIAKKHGLNRDDLYLVNECDGELKVKPGMIINVPRYTTPSKGRTELAKNKKDYHEAKPVREERVEKTDKALAQARKSAPDSEASTIHIVREGETLKTISSRYGVSVASLKSANNLKNNTVYPNMKLRLASHPQKKTVQKKAPVKFHIVKKGETLATISNKYNVDVADIKMANNLKGDKVIPKQKLKIVSEG
jgi:membrane-bound lytic murein transglycosylase D